MRRNFDRKPEGEDEPAPPRIVTVMVLCEKGEPGSYCPIPGGDWYRDVKVNLSTGRTDPPLWDEDRTTSLPFGKALP